MSSDDGDELKQFTVAQLQEFRDGLDGLMNTLFSGNVPSKELLSRMGRLKAYIKLREEIEAEIDTRAGI